MTILHRRTLGTDPVRGWMYYDLHFASSYVFGEFILVGNYRSCIERAERERTVGLGDWARRMRAEGYHQLYAQAFVSMWAVFETSMQNMIAAYLQNDEDVAQAALHNAPRKTRAQYPIDAWPWTKQACLALAKTVESRAKKATPGGWRDPAAQIMTALSWMDVHVKLSTEVSMVLAEANQVRNIFLHRYGEVTEAELAEMPSLYPLVGRVVRMTSERFGRYNSAISELLIAATNAVSESRHHPIDVCD